MGKVIFAIYFPDEYTAAFEYTKKSEIDLHKGEKHILGIDHAVLSGLLMERWNFPDTILMPVRYHHSVDQCPPNYLHSARIIAFSDCLSRAAEFGENWPVKTAAIMKERDQLGITESDAERMAEDLKNDKEEIESFFEVMK